jgi:membrane-bound lytic murein transglycosylase D
MRAVAAATLLLFGACAHAPPPAAPATHARIARVLREVDAPEPSRADVAEATPASTSDADVPAGIDLSRFELPVQYNERVQEYIDLFTTRRRSTLVTWLARMGRYRDMISEQLEARALPRELVYLPLIESAYETNAASHASAVGLWQFMAGTARAEGLEVSEYVDERRDPVRSTEAALRHLEGLYNHFGSWYLAAAAYNSGSTRIGRLLKEHGYPKGQDEVFWALQDALPRETRDYLPMLLAATIIGENLDHFGISVTSEEPVRYDAITVGAATELRAIARAAGAPYEQIKALNPHFIKSMTPPGRRSEVRIPVGTADGFAARLAEIPEDERVRPLTSTHVVKQGETLSGIAQKYGTTVDAITRLNRIRKPDAVAAGRKLVIPGG